MMLKDNNFISAVVYLHNDGARAVEFCRTVAAELDANFKQYELVVVDDACTDDTVKQLRTWGREQDAPLTILHMSIYHGLEDAMNAGLDAAIGDYVYEFDSTELCYAPTLIMQAYRAALDGSDIVSVCPRTVRGGSSLFYKVFNAHSQSAYRLRTDAFRVEEGQTLKLKKLTADQKFTQPPPLYTEATLIHALEENGIGRPSTYAPIITTIVDRGYVEKDQKKLKTTPLGQAVNTVMMEQFPDIFNVKFSADMEKKLDVVEAGQADWVKTIDDFYQGFEKSLEQAEKNMEGKRIKVEDIPTDEICEKCGRPMVIKSGRYGKFVACSGFPECRNAHPLVKDTGGLCPLDGGHMLVRKSAKGRVYYGCSNYPKCNYMTWDEPVPEKCPQCGSTLFKKKGQLYCAKEGCGFVKAIEKK